MAYLHYVKFCKTCKRYFTDKKTVACPKCGQTTANIDKWAVTFRAVESGTPKQKKLGLFDYKREADAAMEKYKAEAQATTAHGVTTFNDLYLAWLAHCKHSMKGSSLVSYNDAIERFVLPEFGQLKISEITPLRVSKWQDSLQANPALNAVSYKRFIRGALGHVFSYAAIYDIENPLKKVKGFKDTNLKAEMTYFTLEEFKTYYAAITEPRWKCVFSFLYFMGTRKGEALALTWKDVDLDSGIVKIYKTLTKDFDATTADKKMLFGDYLITSPKTKNSIRNIAMPAHLIELLKSYKLSLGVDYPHFTEDWFVFGLEGLPMPFNTLGAKHNTITKHAGVHHIRIHDFRHSHAALLISKGDNQLAAVYAIAARLGDTVEEVFQTYGHLFPKSEADILAKLDSDFSL